MAFKISLAAFMIAVVVFVKNILIDFIQREEYYMQLKEYYKKSFQATKSMLHKLKLRLFKK